MDTGTGHHQDMQLSETEFGIYNMKSASGKCGVFRREYDTIMNASHGFSHYEHYDNDILTCYFNCINNCRERKS